VTVVPFLDLRRQTEALRSPLDAAVAAVLDGGRYVLGPVVEEFEQAFASFCGAGHAVGVASGTDAITIALTR
jgi:dTDP-4-amino-4,6-dideoxygalactose transaminase